MGCIFKTSKKFLIALQVISAQMLSFVCEKRPSTYAEATFYGHFSDLSTFAKRKYRTKTVPDCGISAVYATSFQEEEFRFEKVSLKYSGTL